MRYSKYFVKNTRSNGGPYYYLSQLAPNELTILIRSIHHDLFGDCLPNDWLYTKIFFAFLDLEENKLEDMVLELEAETYHSQLIDWLHNPYAEECIIEGTECAIDGSNSIWAMIENGQIVALERIYHRINEFITENVKE